MEVSFNPTPKQYQMFEAFEDEATLEILYGGGVGSGKSYGICALAAAKCIEYPGIRVLLGRNQLKNLKQTTLVSMFEVFTDWGMKPNIHYIYNQGSSEIKFSNGSVILLKELAFLPSDPDFERIRGLLLTFAILDEASEITAKAKELVASRCGRWKNDEYQIKGLSIYTCNPSRGWIYEQFFRPWTINKLPAHRKFIRALPKDNPHLSRTYIDNLKLTLTPAEYRTLVLGDWEFSADENQCTSYEHLLSMYEPNEFVSTSTAEIDNTNFITLDVAFESDKCIAVIWSGLDVVKILDIPKDKKPEDVIKELQKEHDVLTRNLVYDATGSGNYLKNYFPGSYAFHAGGKPIRDKAEFEHLKTQCYFKLAELINDGKIKILDDNFKEELIDECLQIKTIPREKIDGKIKMIKKDEIKKFIGRSPDILDALSERMVFELKSNELPAF